MARAKPMEGLRSLNAPGNGGREGWYFGAVGYGFEVELRGGEEPVVGDGEVEGFGRVGVGEVVGRLERG